MAKKKTLLEMRQEQDKELEQENTVEQVSSQVSTGYTGGAPVEGFIGVEEVILQLGVSRKTALSYLQKGMIKACKFGKRWRILQENLDAFKRGDGPKTGRSEG